MRPTEALGDHDSDSAVQLGCIPVSLLQNLLMERRKTEVILIATFVDV